MSEIITTYFFDDPDQPLPMNRDEFYDSQIELFKNGESPNRAIAVIQILLFTSEGEVILQKRSDSKRHNAGLIDKTVGGHITFGNTTNYTVMAETLQELSIPAIVLDSEEDFKKTFRLLKHHLKNTALLQFIDSRIVKLPKKFKNMPKEIEILDRYYFFLGVYNGSIKPSEREAASIIFYKVDQLKKDLETTSSQFTLDLKFFINKYSDKIDKFLADIR